MKKALSVSHSHYYSTTKTRRIPDNFGERQVANIRRTWLTMKRDFRDWHNNYHKWSHYKCCNWHDMTMQVIEIYSPRFGVTSNFTKKKLRTVLDCTLHYLQILWIICYFYLSFSVTCRLCEYMMNTSNNSTYVDYWPTYRFI